MVAIGVSVLRRPALTLRVVRDGIGHRNATPAPRSATATPGTTLPCIRRKATRPPSASITRNSAECACISCSSTGVPARRRRYRHRYASDTSCSPGRGSAFGMLRGNYGYPRSPGALTDADGASPASHCQSRSARDAACRLRRRRRVRAFAKSGSSSSSTVTGKETGRMKAATAASPSSSSGWHRRWSIVGLCFLAFVLCNMVRRCTPPSHTG